MSQPKTFEELIFEGAITAVRTLSLEELYRQVDHLDAMNLPDDITQFPMAILAAVIAEKQNQRAMN